MRHIFPICLENIASAMASTDDELVPWRSGRKEDTDLFDDGAEFTRSLVAGSTVVYTALTNAAGFAYWYPKHESLIRNIEWRLVILHGDSSWNAFAFLGVFRLLQETGANVRVLIDEKHKRMVSYYERGIIGIAEHGGKVEVVTPCGVDKSEAKVVSLSTITSVSTNTDFDHTRQEKHQAFMVGADKSLVEISAIGKPLSPWESDMPCFSWDLQWCGFPVYINPADLPMIATVIDHLRPAVIFELGAMKHGLTAFLAANSAHVGSRIFAVNDKSFVSRQHQQRLAEHPLGERVHMSTVDFLRDTGGCDDPFAGIDIPGGPALAIFNFHFGLMLDGAMRYTLPRIKHGVVMFIGPDIHDAPGLIKTFASRPDVKKIEMRSNPHGGSWFAGAVYSCIES